MARNPAHPGYDDPNPDWAKPLIAALARAFVPELLKKEFSGGRCRSAGHCYAASETLYHALGGKAAGWKPMSVRAEGVPHWFLQGPGGALVDPTWDQFLAPAPYAEAKGCGFLTREPSARARAMALASGLAPASLVGLPLGPPARKRAGKSLPGPAQG